MVFGLSILYLLALLFLLFQDYKTAKGIFLWIDPKLKDFHIDMDKVTYPSTSTVVFFGKNILNFS